jgi:hypothetical protein
VILLILVVAAAKPVRSTHNLAVEISLQDHPVDVSRAPVDALV